MQCLFNFGHGNHCRRLACRRIDHQRQTGVIQFYFAGQCRFRHTGHADDIATITLQPNDLRHGFKARALSAGIHALVAVSTAFSRQRCNKSRAQRFAVGIAEVDVGHLLQIIGKVGVLATAGVVDQLVRHAEMPGAHGRMNPAHSIHGQDRLGPGLLQCPQISPVVDLMWR